jgi:hypothetical protein
VHEVLVDRGQLVLELGVQVFDDFRIAFLGVILRLSTVTLARFDLLAQGRGCFTKPF